MKLDGKLLEKLVDSVDNEEILEDEFLDFSEENVDDKMDNMHYADEEKISAKEFLTESTIEDHIIADLEEISEIFDAVSIRKELVDEEYLERFKSCLSTYIHIFNITYEFKDFAYTLGLLREFFKFDNSVKREEELKILKSLLDSVIEDLKNWKREVLGEERVVDMHYLDASLLAYVSQIEIMLSIVYKMKRLNFFKF